MVLKAADCFSPIILLDYMTLKFVITNHLIYHYFLYMIDMILVAEVTTMVLSFQQE